MKKRILIGLVCLFPCWLQAKEVCVSYTSDNSIIVGLEKTGNKPEKRVDVLIKRYIRFAKKNDTKSLLKIFSRIDGSDKALKKELQKVPDKFSSYSGMKSVTPGDTFRWGNYSLVQTYYQHVRGNLDLTDAYYCSPGICQVSYLFDQPDDATFLVSRFLYLYKASLRNKKTGVACPKVKPSFEVMPKVSTSKKFPMHVYVGKQVKLEKANMLSPKTIAKLPANIRSCYKQISEFVGAPTLDGGSGKAKEDWSKVVASVINQCATNMNPKSLVPVIALDKPIASNYMIPEAFVAMAKNSSSLKPVLRIKDKAWKVVVGLSNSDGGERVVVIPVKEHGGRAFFDWKYFGTGAGELLTSAYFGKYVQTQLK